MAKALPQITFEFSDSGEESGKEFLSGAPVPPPVPPKPRSTRGRKSLKEVAEVAELVSLPPDEVLFRKQYYGIGEVAQMFHVNASLLRHWEAEFGFNLRKNRKGDRFFTPQDVKTIELIHDLVRRRKFTIDGARDYLKQNKMAEEKWAMIQSLQRLKGFILELKATL